MPGVPEVVTGAIREFLRLVATRFGGRLRRAVLFGSHARGEAGPESDVDVLVIVDGLVHAERSWIYETAAEVWMNTGVRLAPLALSSTEYADIERRELLLAGDIARDGVPL